ncbi:MAG: type IV toxin-antitoxin system AbiEi family antitoxin domain-containing protein [Solirubrobacterales bacterium]|nr:type IV toxin-antitoxin system AbiEi family antitoxin domain-containing protein [Solirubrobacterales bacterium]MCB8970911.1 type IV toxin-antitoxin system AbiEi family antitoxin domain-containing protein [Thermoleophilales bacterium]
MDSEIEIGEGGRPKGRPRNVDRRIAGIAGAQHGVISLRQLIELGLSRRAVSHRVEAGRLHRVHRGVFAVGHRLLTPSGWRMAAVLACGPGAVLSHRAAGAEWAMLRWSGRDEVLVPSPRRARSGLIVRSANLPPDEVTVENDIPITTPVRTLLDLASVLAPDQLLKAVNEVHEQRRLWGAISLEAMIERHRGERGVRRLRSMLAEAGYGIPQRELEEAFSRFVAERCLPRPELQGVVRVDGRYFKGDAVWRSQRLIVELHSAGHHGTAPKITRDATRDRLLLIAGWTVVHVTWAQLHDPREVRALERDLRKLLRAPSG